MSQLLLLLSLFPPHRDDCAAYKQLLQSALEHGALTHPSSSHPSPNLNTAVFLLLDRMSVTPAAACPDSARILRLLLQGGEMAGAGSGSSLLSADRSGRTVLDVPELVPQSCLAAVKPLLKDFCQRLRLGHEDRSSESTSMSFETQSQKRRGRDASVMEGWVLERDGQTRQQAQRSLSSSAVLARAESNRYLNNFDSVTSAHYFRASKEL